MKDDLLVAMKDVLLIIGALSILLSILVVVIELVHNLIPPSHTANTSYGYVDLCSRGNFNATSTSCSHIETGDLRLPFGDNSLRLPVGNKSMIVFHSDRSIPVWVHLGFGSDPTRNGLGVGLDTLLPEVFAKLPPDQFSTARSIAVSVDVFMQQILLEASRKGYSSKPYCDEVYSFEIYENYNFDIGDLSLHYGC